MQIFTAMVRFKFFFLKLSMFFASWKLSPLKGVLTEQLEQYLHLCFVLRLVWPFWRGLLDRQTDKRKTGLLSAHMS